MFNYDGDMIEENIYTMDSWRLDGTFNADPGQEIDEEVYYRFFEDLPPVKLPHIPQTAGYSAGFLSSEPYGVRDGHMTYLGFGKKNGRYYYIGLVPASDRWVHDHMH